MPADSAGGRLMDPTPRLDRLPPRPDRRVPFPPVGVLTTVTCDPWHWRDKVLVMHDATHATVPFRRPRAAWPTSLPAGEDPSGTSELGR
jgi:hypothetical protein